MEMKSRSALVYTALTLSMLCAIICGIDMAFNVYSTEMKETFNLTETQVEALASLDGLGIGLRCLEIPMFLQFGYKATFITTWLMMSLASGCLSLASYAREQTMEHIWVIFLAQLSWAIGNNMSFMVMTRAVMSACPTNQTGKLVAMFYAMGCLGKIFFGGLMDAFFTNNLSGFFLTLSVLSTILVGLNFRVLLHLINSEEVNTDKSNQELTIRKKVQTELNSLITKPNENSEEKLKHEGNGIQGANASLTEMLRSSFFHLLFWSVLAFYAIPFSIMNNITTIAVSQRVSHPLNTVYILALCIITLRISFGVILDKFPSTLVGFVLLLCGDSTLLVAISMCLFYLGPTTVYVISALIGVSLSSGFTVCVTMLIKRYGKEHYSFLTCAFYAIFVIALTSLQLLFGYVYDLNSKSEKETIFCFGVECFYHTFVVMLICAVISFVMKSALFVYTLITDRPTLK